MKALAAVRMLVVLGTAPLVLAPRPALSQAPESPAPIVTAVDDGTWRELPPPGRAAHIAIYDPVADQMIVFGGTTPQRTNALWSLALSGTPFWYRPAASGTPPALDDHTAIYDPVRRRILIFAGQTFGGQGTLLNGLWELSLIGAPVWTQLSPTGTPPAPRRAHTAIYDPVRDRMIVYGGIGASDVVLGDVWALSLGGTPAWTEITPAGSPPTPRLHHAAIYDPGADRMIVFGGEPEEYYGGSNELWQLTLAGTPTWSQLAVAGPPDGMARHTALCDPPRNRMIVFSGYAGCCSYPLWQLTLGGSPAWSQIAPSGGPPPRREDHSAVYDPVRDRMIVYGGDDHSFSNRNDVWALDLATPAWNEIGPVAPSPRWRHSAIFDAPRRRMIVFGGWESFEQELDDVWSLSLEGYPTWSRIVPAGPGPEARMDHSAIFDPLRERMIVFSGWDQGGPIENDTWSLSLGGPPAWTQLMPSGTPPSGRIGHTAIYDQERDRMVVFGGQEGFGNVPLRNDVWELTLSGTPTWTQLFPSGGPPSVRREHTAIYDPVRERMIVYGGIIDNINTRIGDLWELSLSGTPAWTQLAPTGGPPRVREGHAAVYDPVRDRMIVYSGNQAGPAQFTNEVWALSLAGAPVWTQLAPAGGPPILGRLDHTLIYDAPSDRLVVFGGFRYDGIESPNTMYDAFLLEFNPLVSVSPSRELVAALSARIVPNPAAGPLAIDYTLPRAGPLTLRVYDLSGRVVKTLSHGTFAAGPHSTRWDRRDEHGIPARAGVYFFALEMDRARLVKRLVLLD